MTVLAGALVAVLLVAASASGDVQYVARGPSLSFESAPEFPPTTIRTEDDDAEEDDEREVSRVAFELPDVVSSVLQLALLAGAIALAAITLRYFWRNRPDLRWRRRGPAPAFDVVADVATAITDDAAAQHAALRTGAPRNAIVACWLRLESAVVDAGCRRSPADTSADLTQRVLSDFAVDAQAITELADLYREARFSAHDMDESARGRAIRSLDQVHDDLRHRARRAADDRAPIAGTAP